MALAMGSGPFGPSPAGIFNFTSDAPARVLYLEDRPHRVRLVVAGETIARSDRAKLLHETSLLPVYYLPEEDVRTDLLEPTDRVTHCPYKGDARYWTIRVGDEVRDDAVWNYPTPLEGAPPLSSLLAFTFRSIDEWWEEDELVSVHPRDPYHRCDVIRSDRHVIVRVGGRIIAESTRPTMLFETALPPRIYLPEEDVDTSYLHRSATVTRCPYKGTANRYYAIEADGQRIEDAFWVIDDPNDEAAKVAGLFAVYQERVDVEVDGQPWS